LALSVTLNLALAASQTISPQDMSVAPNGLTGAHASRFEASQGEKSTQHEPGSYTQTQNCRFAAAVMFRKVKQEVAIPKYLSIIERKLIDAMSTTMNEDCLRAINNLPAV
jgi:hypothetical protein